jgi:phosphopantothenoylcysteine decarboxylase/phosphopantothenate--cysteine ligase
MYEKAVLCSDEADVVILAAAVADYTPKTVADKKIKKKEKEFELTLSKTVDIASEIGNRKKTGQFLVGFALETDNEVENAKAKLVSKNLDMIVLNSLNDKGAGFSHDTNKITIITKDNNVTPFELKNKKEVARDITNAVLEKINA